jgi:serine/threonine protein kinase
MIGKLLNAQYEIREQLSKKAGRRTFLAQDLHSQNLVIIKVLLFEQDFEWDDLKLFEREAKTLKNLDHPAIPKYLDYFKVADESYHGFALVQTYIDAPSLEVLIQQGRKFSETDLRELAEKLLDILNYLHGQIPVVIHRDIKPSNILLANRSGNSIGDIYLVDFGSVQTAASKEVGTITIVGSYGYIPLEQFGGQAVPASDLYSLGMTIIYLATGTHPAEIPQINGQTKFSTPQLSKQFQKWLDKMIQPHLNRRFDSAQLAKKALNFSASNYSELRPRGTKVQFYRDLEQMEIILPNPTLFSKMLENILGIGFVCFFFSSFIINIAGGASGFVIGIVISLYLLIIVFFPKEGFTKISITIDQIKAYQSSVIGIYKSPALISNRSEISLLGYSPSYKFDSF